MRQFFLFGFMLLLLTFTACDDDFELEAPYADLPVVNAYLDVDADDNFIRVQKAFLGTGGNALLAAQNPDSIYYNEEQAAVSLIVDGEDAFELERVDGADFGIVRDTGTFANTPNILYHVPASANLSRDDQVTVIISRSGEEDATATTTMVSPVNIQRPEDFQGLRLGNYAQFTNLVWNVNEAARIFDIRMDIRIREFDANNPDMNEVRTLTWNIASNFRRESDGATLNLQVRNEGFWQFLGNTLSSDDDVLRQLLDFDVIITAAGSEVVEAIDLANANGGITSAQSIPVYTNVDNGLGIFTSRNVGTAVGLVLEGIGVGDTLRNGIYTRGLGFQ